MAEKPLTTAEELRGLIARGEGEFLELKGTWDYEGSQPRPLGRDKLRSVVAEYVAAFANADGGTLLLGVEDDGEVTGHGLGPDRIEDLIYVPQRRLTPEVKCDHQLVQLDGKEVLVLEIPRAPRAVMVNGDGYPYRTGDQTPAMSEEWINDLKRSYLERGFEQRLAAAVLDDIDLDLLPAAAREPNWLALRGLVVPRSGTAAVSNAAVLLAGRSPITRWHESLSLRIFRVAGTEQVRGEHRNVTQVARLDQPIAQLISSAYDLIRGQIGRSEKLHDLFFREFPEYPTFAWQEAVVNAVAHRDYADQSRGIEVWIYDDRMEIQSPGAPVSPVTIEQLQQRGGIHASRNPRIARVLTELGLMREEGEGVPRMFEEMESSFLHPPEFSATSDTTTVILRNTPIFETADETLRHIVERLTTVDAYRRVLLLHPGGFTNEEYRSVNGVDRDEAYRQIKDMVDAGLVLPPGHPGRGKYVLSPDVLQTRAWLEQRLPQVRSLIAEKGSITNAEYRTLFGVSRYVAVNELRRLVDEGLLDLRGAKRGAHYVLGSDLKRK